MAYYLEKGKTYYKMREYEMSVEVFVFALNIDDKNFKIKFNLGNTYGQLFDY